MHKSGVRRKGKGVEGAEESVSGTMSREGKKREEKKKHN